MEEPTRYSWVQITLHWLIAALIVANYFVSEGMGRIFDGTLEGKVPTGWTSTFHVWVGTAILVLVVLRLIARGVTGAPKHASGNALLDRASVWGQWLLYTLMLVAPALGALTWFGGLESTADLHVLAVNALMILALGHAAMAMVHQFVFKDGLLLRMVRTR
jgi:cytochrome b561